MAKARARDDAHAGPWFPGKGLHGAIVERSGYADIQCINAEDAHIVAARLNRAYAEGFRSGVHETVRELRPYLRRNRKRAK